MRNDPENSLLTKGCRENERHFDTISYAKSSPMAFIRISQYPMSQRDLQQHRANQSSPYPMMVSTVDTILLAHNHMSHSLLNNNLTSAPRTGQASMFKGQISKFKPENFTDGA
ncbi:unnamed protein product [Ilex paraguariensis]|uniref:Uncharacterized protein n=1 Tax=Ilex paraguariensis TaxID=185542 RepID=A0ABC8T385_9AQUA